MLKHMEEWSPIKIGSQASPSKGEVKERVSISKDRSRLGKEPMGAAEMPKSWYDLVRRPYVDEETPVMDQGQRVNVKHKDYLGKGHMIILYLNPFFRDQKRN